jgi:hypothetical protein
MMTHFFESENMNLAVQAICARWYAPYNEHSEQT